MADDKPETKEPITGKSIRLTPEEIEALREDDLKAHLRMQELISQAKARGEL